MGVLIGILGGNEETVETIKVMLNKKIANLQLKENVILVTIADVGTIEIWDDGQSCCENRYISSDDELRKVIGAKLLNIELKDAPNIADEYGTHEVQFLQLRTTKGIVTFETHNEHNGYYGGFYLKAQLAEKKEGK